MKNGFKRFDAVLNIQTDEGHCFDDGTSTPVPTVDDVIFDSIFSKDERGWPRTSLAAMLSDKTQDDVRKYIQDHIMVAHEQNHLISDDKVIAAFKDLDSEFIAETSPNKFETADQYDKRISAYLERMRDKESLDKRAKSWKNFLDKYQKKEDENK